MLVEYSVIFCGDQSIPNWKREEFIQSKHNTRMKAVPTLTQIFARNLADEVCNYISKKEYHPDLIKI